MMRELIVRGSEVEVGDHVVRYGVIRIVTEVEDQGVNLKVRFQPTQPGIGWLYVTPNQLIQVSRAMGPGMSLRIGLV